MRGGVGWGQVTGSPLRRDQEAFAVSLILRWRGGSGLSGRTKDVPCSRSRTRGPGRALDSAEAGGGGGGGRPRGVPRGPPQTASGAGLRVLALAHAVLASLRGARAEVHLVRAPSPCALRYALGLAAPGGPAGRARAGRSRRSSFV